MPFIRAITPFTNTRVTTTWMFFKNMVTFLQFKQLEEVNKYTTPGLISDALREFHSEFSSATGFFLRKFFFESSEKLANFTCTTKKQQCLILCVFYSPFSTLSRCVLVFSHMLGQMPFGEVYGDMCTTEETNMISVRREACRLAYFMLVHLGECVKILGDFINYINISIFAHHLSKLKKNKATYQGHHPLRVVIVTLTIPPDWFL